MKKILSIIILIAMSYTLSWIGHANYSATPEEVEATLLLWERHYIDRKDVDYDFEHSHLSVSRWFSDGQGQLKQDIPGLKWPGWATNIEELIAAIVELFRLWDTITRQEVMKILAKISEEDIEDTCRWEFNDVDKNGWGCKYIEWALGKWFIAENEIFRPDDNITKTEAMKLILNVKWIPKVNETENWQKDYADTALEYGIVEEAYTDYNADARRGWLFLIAATTIEKEEEIKKKLRENQEIEEEEIVSDEVDPK